jgi:prepilin-type N-terminal cleavage/methylation domain-containing protein
MKSKNKHNKKGFTLIETLVAISILMISITGPMVFAAQGLQASMYARDQITAFYLAQDAVETVRNIRDNYALWLQGGIPTDHWIGEAIREECVNYAVDDNKVCEVDSTVNFEWDWDGGFVAPYDQTAGPYRKPINIPIKECSSTDPCRVKQKTDFTYGYGVGTDTKYVREVVMTEIDPDQILIEVTVRWTTNGAAQKEFTVKENIFQIYGQELQ